MEKLTEYREYPKWIDTMTKDEQHEWYLWAKNELLPTLNRFSNTDILETAINDYEEKNNLK